MFCRKRTSPLSRFARRPLSWKERGKRVRWNKERHSFAGGMSHVAPMGLVEETCDGCSIPLSRFARHPLSWEEKGKRVRWKDIHLAGGMSHVAPMGLIEIDGLDFL